jgi:transcriptional regulator with XRE-family HTH domain
MTADTPAQIVAKSWGKRLHLRRKDLGLTQVTLAEKVNMDQATISRFERGHATWTPEAMLTFSVALDFPLDRLFPWPLGIEGMEIMRQEGAAKRKQSAA